MVKQVGVFQEDVIFMILTLYETNTEPEKGPCIFYRYPSMIRTVKKLTVID